MDNEQIGPPPTGIQDNTGVIGVTQEEADAICAADPRCHTDTPVPSPSQKPA